MPAPISAASAAGAMDADGNDAADSHHPAQRKAVVNFYELLGVAKDASEGDIKKAYKKKSLKLHPDKNPDDPDAERKFAELSQAYTTLLDPVKRIDHNKEHLLATREKNVVAAVVEDFEKTWAATEEITNDDLVTLATAAAKRKGSRQRSSSRSVSRSVSATSVEEKAEGVYADGGS